MKLNRLRISNVAAIEVFGAAFALLIVLFLMLNMLSESQIQTRLENQIEQGHYKISWDKQGEGFVVIAFPNKLLIVEKGHYIDQDKLCTSGSLFIDYARQIYQHAKQQLIFAILQQGIGTMRIARDCLMHIFPKKAISVGWIIANQELLKSVQINQIPSYIKKALE